MVETIRKHEAPPILSSPEETPTAAYLTNVFFNTFYFSQGFPQLQREITGAIHTNHPEWQISVEAATQILNAVTSRIHGFLTHAENAPHQRENSTVVHPDLGEKKIEVETTDRFTEFKGILNGDYDTRSPRYGSIPAIAKAMIQQDFAFLSRENGRTRKNIPTKSPQTDPWLSHMCYYVLEGNSTGIVEFDEVFAAVREFMLTSSNRLFAGNYELDAQYDKVLQIYQEKHPEKLAEKEVLLFEV